MAACLLKANDLSRAAFKRIALVAPIRLRALVTSSSSPIIDPPHGEAFLELPAVHRFVSLG